MNRQQSELNQEQQEVSVIDVCKVSVSTSFEIKANQKIASKMAIGIVSDALGIKKQIDALTLIYKDCQEKIKKSFGEKTEMFLEDGVLLATYKQGKDKEVVDKKLLKEKYSYVYNIVADLKEGSKVLLLK